MCLKPWWHKWCHGEPQRRGTDQQWQSGTPQLKWVPMKPLNKGPGSEWALACTGLKLCPPFNTLCTEGTKATLDTVLNRSRRSTIPCDKRRLCAGEVTWKKTDNKPPFMIPPASGHPHRVMPTTQKTLLSTHNSNKPDVKKVNTLLSYPVITFSAELFKTPDEAWCN